MLLLLQKAAWMVLPPLLSRKGYSSHAAHKNAKKKGKKSPRTRARCARAANVAVSPAHAAAITQNSAQNEGAVPIRVARQRRARVCAKMCSVTCVRSRARAVRGGGVQQNAAGS